MAYPQAAADHSRREFADPSRPDVASSFSSAQALRRSGKAEAVSIFPVQPWMDIDEMGCAVVAVTNGDARAAQKHADALARAAVE